MLGFVYNLAGKAGPLGALGFVLGGFLEETLLPLPSPLLIVGAGLFLNEPLTALNLAKMFGYVIIPTALGDIIGALLTYWLCYRFGKPAIDRWSRFLGFSWDDVAKLQNKLAKAKSDELVLFITRCIPFAPTKIFNAAAGVIRMPLGRFIFLIVVGILVRLTLLFFGSLYFGDTLFGLRAI